MNISCFSRSVTSLSLPALLLCALCSGQTVAPEFQPSVAEVQNQLASFDAKLHASWDRTLAPVDFSAEIPVANCVRGAGLLGTYALDGVMTYIDRVQNLGVKAVTINVSYPTLLPEFYGSSAEHAQYLAFYTELARRVKARNLKLIIKSTGTLVSGGGSSRYTLAAFYKTVTSFQKYIEGRSTVARTIATHLQPDYMVVMMEPDVEQGQTGQPVNTTDNSVALSKQVSAAVKSVAPAVKVGAGAGTWVPNYKTLAEQLAAVPSLDFVNMHVYPISLGFLDRAAEIADIAAARGKRVAISETWAYKTTSLELAGSQRDPAGFYRMISRRDYFSDMSATDSQHLQTMIRFAHWKRLVFLSPAMTNLFFAYLDYAQHRYTSQETLILTSQWQAWTNMQAGTYTQTGLNFSSMLPR